MMAYKSRNTVFRILDGEGGHTARQTCFERLKKENPLDLDEEAFKRLARGMEISRVGLSAFRSNLALRELLMETPGELAGEMHAMQGTPISFIGGRREASAMIAEIVRSNVLELTIIGCCSRQILETLRERLARKDVTRMLTVRHIIYMGEEDVVSSVAAIQPMLYADFYSAYCVEPGLFSAQRE